MYIKVRVITASKYEEIEKVGDVVFKISVKEKPERNLANKRITEIIAGYFGIVPGKVRLVSGHHSPSKIFNIILEK